MAQVEKGLATGETAINHGVRQGRGANQGPQAVFAAPLDHSAPETEALLTQYEFP